MIKIKSVRLQQNTFAFGRQLNVFDDDPKQGTAIEMLYDPEKQVLICRRRFPLPDGTRPVVVIPTSNIASMVMFTDPFVAIDKPQALQAVYQDEEQTRPGSTPHPAVLKLAEPAEPPKNKGGRPKKAGKPLED